MSEWFDDLRVVEWFRDQFADPSATSMFRLVLLAWVATAIVLIATDRFGAMLLGRSRPLAQEPPVRARAWRWGRRTPPPNYSLLPPGVAAVPQVTTPVALDRPTSNPLAELPVAAQQLDDITFGEPLPDPSADLDDVSFWRLFADAESPLFGFENAARLARGEAPERYNPIAGRVEALERDRDAAVITWPNRADSTLLIGRSE